jgi:hypothetical protein
MKIRLTTGSHDARKWRQKEPCYGWQFFGVQKENSVYIYFKPSVYFKFGVVLVLKPFKVRKIK